MAQCKSCAAPLPPHTGVCGYCGSRNDIDLKGIHEFSVNRPESERICPQCGIPLKTLDLGIDGKFFIERCETCLGLFFDPGELEAILEKSVANVFVVDRKRLDNLQLERNAAPNEVVYRKCPICDHLMHRMNYGHRSGVIVDRCKSHGVWLDSGELRQLLEWRKAGGQMLHETVKERREKEKEKQARQQRLYQDAAAIDPVEGSLSSTPSGAEIDLIDTITGIIGKLFR